MKKLVIVCVFIILGCKSKPIPNQEKINVLFIGNSLTYYHDMPKTLQSMLNETNSNFKIEQSTYAGMRLSSHLTEIITKNSGDTLYTREKEIGEITETEKKLTSKNWDIIVLQEGSGNQYFPDVVKEVISPTISKMKQLVSNKDCKYIMFNVWPRKGDYPREKKCLPKFYFYPDMISYADESKNEKTCSQEIMNLEEDVKILNESYDPIKEENDLTISNHCNIHYKARVTYPEIELYDDEYHPSEYGSFLNACVFYKLLTNKKPSQLKFNGKLDSKSSKILKTLSD